MKKLLTVKEAAQMLQVHRSTIYRLSREGRLPIVKLAAGISRVRMGDIEDLLAQAGTVHQEGGESDGTG